CNRIIFSFLYPFVIFLNCIFLFLTIITSVVFAVIYTPQSFIFLSFIIQRDAPNGFIDNFIIFYFVHFLVSMMPNKSSKNFVACSHVRPALFGIPSKENFAPLLSSIIKENSFVFGAIQTSLGATGVVTMSPTGVFSVTLSCTSCF